MYTVYLIRCLDGYIYTGQTKNLINRFHLHRAGYGANFTKKHGAKEVIYTEIFSTEELAKKREKQIQSWHHDSKTELANGILINPIIVRERIADKFEWNNNIRPYKNGSGYRYFSGTNFLPKKAGIFS